MTRPERRVLAAIAAREPTAYGISILAEINSAIRSNWITRRWPWLDFRGMGVGTLYVCLMRLEIRGMICSAWEPDAPPEREAGRRRHYFLTDVGREALASGGGA